LTRETNNQPPEGGKEEKMETKNPKLTDKQIREMILAGQIELTDVINAVIGLNGTIGVGLIRNPKLTDEQIRQMILAGQIELTDVIDAVINLNGIIGVGLIELADYVSDYIRQH